MNFTNFSTYILFSTYITFHSLVWVYFLKIILNNSIYRDCEQDRPAYIVFQLDKILDVNKETSYFEWTELQNNLARFSSAVDVGLLKTISVNFNKLLTKMLTISNVDLAKYRWAYLLYLYFLTISGVQAEMMKWY